MFASQMTRWVHRRCARHATEAQVAELRRKSRARAACHAFDARAVQLRRRSRNRGARRAGEAGVRLRRCVCTGAAAQAHALTRARLRRMPWRTNASRP